MPMDKDTRLSLRNLSVFLIENNKTDFWKTGSQVVKGIKPKDYDWLIYEPKAESEDDSSVLRFLRKEGYSWDTAYDNTHLEASFKSFRQNNLNVIYTQNKKFFEKFRAASIMVEEKQLKNKEDRVAMHEAIMGGEYSEAFEKIMQPDNHIEAGPTGRSKGFATSVGSLRSSSSGSL